MNSWSTNENAVCNNLTAHLKLIYYCIVNIKLSDRFTWKQFVFATFSHCDVRCLNLTQVSHIKYAHATYAQSCEKKKVLVQIGQYMNCIKKFLIIYFLLFGFTFDSNIVSRYVFPKLSIIWLSNLLILMKVILSVPDEGYSERT